MSNPRTEFTATLLPDGRVLATGSTQLEDATTTELYDPGSGD
jgi:deoxycytidylate deaminase